MQEKKSCNCLFIVSSLFLHKKSYIKLILTFYAKYIYNTLLKYYFRFFISVMIIDMTEIFDAFLEFVAAGIALWVISWILSIISIPLGKRVGWFLPIIFIILPFIGDQSWRAYLLWFLMLFVISFVLINLFKALFSR